MATKWREGEVPVITVTPVSTGVVRPFALLVLASVAIVEGAAHVRVVHDVQSWLALVVLVPIVIVILTRTWRWRSYKIHVTNQRVALEGGVLRHWRTSVEWRDVLATRVDQRVRERLTRRGVVVLETGLGPIATGRVRHPGALCRLIDAERNVAAATVPFDTIFGFEEPDRFNFDTGPDDPRRSWGE